MRKCLASIIGVVMCGAACNTPATHKESVSSASEAESFAGNVQELGKIAYGKTSATIVYANPPRYRALKFTGQLGDNVDIWVRSTDGDSMAWLVDDAYNVIASNDDADGTTTDSRIAIALPATTSGVYHIVFREYGLSNASFVVHLDGPLEGTVPEAGVDASGDDASEAGIDASTSDAAGAACATTNFATDPANCGACGHSCLGGACSAGVCQASVVIPSVAGWTMDDTNFYYADSSGTWIAPKAGGARTRLGTNGLPGGYFFVDSSFVYALAFSLTMSPTLFAIPKTGVGNWTSLGTVHYSSMPGEGVFKLGSTIYWVGNDSRPGPPSGSKLLSAAVAGTTPTTIKWYGMNDVLGADTDGTDPLFVSYKPAGCATWFCVTNLQTSVLTPVGSGTVRGFAVDTDFFFVEMSLETTPYTYEIHRVTRATSATLALGQGSGYGGALAVDGAYVYWADQTYVQRVPKAGGPAQILSSAGGPSSPLWGFDNTYAYWVDAQQRLVRAVK